MTLYEVVSDRRPDAYLSGIPSLRDSASMLLSLVGLDLAWACSVGAVTPSQTFDAHFHHNNYRPGPKKVRKAYDNQS